MRAKICKGNFKENNNVTTSNDVDSNEESEDEDVCEAGRIVKSWRMKKIRWNS